MIEYSVVWVAYAQSVGKLNAMDDDERRQVVPVDAGEFAVLATSEPRALAMVARMVRFLVPGVKSMQSEVVASKAVDDGGGA